MKILFVQLPITDHALSYIHGNVEYAPASIAAYIKHHLHKEITFEFLPFIISNFASNLSIVQYITQINPDILCFSNYLWNIERHLRIAHIIKQSYSHIKIIFGGPEISKGSYVFEEHHPQVDYFVIGEGEWFFRRFFEGSLHQYIATIRSNRAIIQPSRELISINELVEPFTAGYLNPMPDGSIFLEMMRGCPYRCDYCFYSKNSTIIREQPIDVLINALTSSKFNLREIYILSPTFNRVTNFAQLLEIIHTHNPGIRLHTEMRADSIDENTAKLIRKAGFTSLEIGVQTFTKKALVNINRHSNPKSELKGMKYLRDVGIDLKIGIIPGLPGDTPYNFIKTIETLVQEGFSENIELYPLMVLPGTRMRDIAKENNAQFLKKPPYYFLNGWEFSEDDLVEIAKIAEESTGYTTTVDFLPEFSLPFNGFLTAGIFIDCGKNSHWFELNISNHIQCCVFTILLKFDDYSAIRNFHYFSQLLPLDDQLYIIIFLSNLLIDEYYILQSIFHKNADSFFSRVNYFNTNYEKSHFRVFQVFSTYSAYDHAKEKYSSIIPIMKIHPHTSNVIYKMNATEDYILVDKQSYCILRPQLITKFADAPECVAFELKTDKEDFYRSIGKEFYDIHGLYIKLLH